MRCSKSKRLLTNRQSSVGAQKSMECPKSKIPQHRDQLYNLCAKNDFPEAFVRMISSFLVGGFAGGCSLALLPWLCWGLKGSHPTWDSSAADISDDFFSKLSQNELALALLYIYPEGIKKADQNASIGKCSIQFWRQVWSAMNDKCTSYEYCIRRLK